MLWYLSLRLLKLSWRVYLTSPRSLVLRVFDSILSSLQVFDSLNSLKVAKTFYDFSFLRIYEHMMSLRLFVYFAYMITVYYEISLRLSESSALFIDWQFLLSNYLQLFVSLSLRVSVTFYVLSVLEVPLSWLFDLQVLKLTDYVIEYLRPFNSSSLSVMVYQFSLWYFFWLFNFTIFGSSSRLFYYQFLTSTSSTLGISESSNIPCIDNFFFFKLRLFDPSDIQVFESPNLEKFMTASPNHTFPNKSYIGPLVASQSRCSRVISNSSYTLNHAGT